MAAPMGTRLRRVLLLTILVVAAALIFSFSRGPRLIGADEPDADEQENPLGPNAACYVCHIPFVKEDLSSTHLEGRVTCITCHGLSAAHANDENIGATPPDVRFRRDQVDPLCWRCHPRHDAPAREVIGRFLERGLPPKSAPVCTACHGRHKIERPAEQ